MKKSAGLVRIRMSRASICGQEELDQFKDKKPLAKNSEHDVGIRAAIVMEMVDGCCEEKWSQFLILIR